MTLEIITQKPTGTPKPTPILFVHGILHGAWCWDEYWLPYFAQHGYIACALSLRGHGNSSLTGDLRFTSVHNYVDDVASVAQQLETEYGTRPIMIGHSMGGLVVQKYLEKYDAPATVLVASVPTRGVLRTALTLIARFPVQMTQLILTLKYLHLKKNREFVRYFAFSKDMPVDELDKHRLRFGDESFRAFMDMMFLALPRPKAIHKTRMLVICAENDTLFTVNEERITANAYGADFVQIANTAHDMMLEKTWRESADAVLKWLEK